MIPGTRGALMTRVATAFILMAIILVLIWTPMLRMALAAFITALVAVGLFEFFGLARARGIEPETLGGVFLGSAITFSGFWARQEIIDTVLIFAVMVLATLHLFRRKHTFSGLSVSIFGMVYLGWIPAQFLAMHGLPGQGPGLTMALLVSVIGSDTGAYFVGKSFGARKLAPKISPNKTWEGAAGGVAMAVAAMLVLYGLRYAGWSHLPDWPLAMYVLSGVLLAVVSQLGDLMESMLKRDAGRKDSGKLFPGHGGVLDRCDGLLFASPVLYYMAIWSVRF